MFGDIDIYLFDQLLKGRYEGCRKILDAGCGYGRNVIYFLQHNYEVFGIDQNADAIFEVKKLSQQLAPRNPLDNFRVSSIENVPFEDVTFDLVVCSAVLHFAESNRHFEKMLGSIWRVLKPGGFLFVRLASDIGIEKLVIALGDGRYRLPDGSDRYLVNEKMLLNYSKELGGQLIEPIKSTNVQNMRCMTTWCLQKNKVSV